MIIIEYGKIKCHVNNINWSYRNRGSDPRNKINKPIIILPPNIINKIFIRKNLFDKKNKVIDNTLIKIIPVYSAINNNANPPPPYSTLNPETNSDSPSTKSNGARLVSANDVIIHNIKINTINKNIGK